MDELYIFQLLRQELAYVVIYPEYENRFATYGIHFYSVHLFFSKCMDCLIYCSQNKAPCSVSEYPHHIHSSHPPPKKNPKRNKSNFSVSRVNITSDNVKPVVDSL